MVKLGDDYYGMRALPDNSLVVENRYAVRYARGSGPAAELGVLADKRTEAERDRGRLAYAPAVRRLAGVTQVVSPDLNSAELHSRATHTYKVAMVAREIAEHITRKVFERDADAEAIADVIKEAGGLDIAACEAAGLAHDLGHPPFGHAGEEALDRLLLIKEDRSDDGFEGNAQSFRIVTTLERVKINNTMNGLDLTNVTLAGILKYPKTRTEPFEEPANRKFGSYRTEAADLDRARAAVFPDGDSGQQSLEASIMDLADDIAYAIHDLEDFFAAGVIEPRQVLSDLDDAIKGVKDTNDFTESKANDPFTAESGRLRDKYAGYFSDEEYVQALKFAKSLVDDAPNDYDDPLAFTNLRTNLAGVVKELFGSLCVSATPPYVNGPRVFLEARQWHRVQVLKTITRRFLVNRSPMGMLQQSQSAIITVLFGKLEEWLLEGPKEHHLPVPLRRVMRAANVENPGRGSLNKAHYRAIADYICTMSDAEAALRARYLTGVEVPSTATLGIRP